MASRAGKRRAKRGLPLSKLATCAPARYHFSDNRHQFHNATPHARAALLNGPPRLVAEDEHRVAVVFSVPKDWRLRARFESAKLYELIRELRLPEAVPYPPPREPAFLGPPAYASRLTL
jgi:hypothetical protein